MLRAFLLNALFIGTMFAADDWSLSGYAVNGFAVDLLHKNSAAENAVFSPFSIQLALGMALAGAQGETQKQMRMVLHDAHEFADDAFAALNQKSLDALTKSAASRGKSGGDPITLTVANRIYGQSGFQFRPEYLELLRGKYGAPLEELNFSASAAAARTINAWIEKQTHNRIRDLVDPSALSDLTRLVLANAIYLKAPWAESFDKHLTKPGLFRISNGELVRVPMMSQEASLGYKRSKGLTVVAVPYVGGDLQFLILLPDAPDGLPALEKKLAGGSLSACALLPATSVQLHLPKFKIEPPVMNLGVVLQELGMPSAFNMPRGSANFGGIAAPKSGEELYISGVFHRAFISVDEQGTEAAAATVVAMMGFSAPIRKEPVQVWVNRPFLFAVQHKPSGACLFLGRVTDPR